MIEVVSILGMVWIVIALFAAAMTLVGIVLGFIIDCTITISDRVRYGSW